MAMIRLPMTLRHWAYFRERRRQHHRFVLQRNGRCFLLTVPRVTEDQIVAVGQLRPHPQLHGTRSGHFVTGPTQAYLDFSILTTPTRTFGKFAGIGIPDGYHRQGWATDMVGALLDFYEDIPFYNSSLNEKSGPLFCKLQAEHPVRLAPIRLHEDGGYEVDVYWSPKGDEPISWDDAAMRSLSDR